jgi:N-acetylneuraminic acid mutarotase
MLSGWFVVPPPPTPGWEEKASLPAGPKAKNVKDGGSLAYCALVGSEYIYGLKGNNTLEFYRYDIAGNSWTTLESMPAFGSAGKKKTVKKGGSLATCHT